MTCDWVTNSIGINLGNWESSDAIDAMMHDYMIWD
jgi:hypothetical protein